MLDRHSRRHSSYRYGRTRIKRKDIIKTIIAMCIAAAVLLAAFVVISRWEDAKYTVQNDLTGDVYVEPVVQKPKTIKVDGVKYRQKGRIESYLFMGIDTRGEVAPVDGFVGGGQADVQLLLVIDNQAQLWRILQLNRDSIVEVPVLGVTGQRIGTQQEQLALAHSYGTGMEDSCRNTVDAVSMMLWDQPIHGYFAMNLDAIALVNDAVGGVPVEITSDFTKVDPSLKLGQTVTLKGKQALTFLQSRRNVDDQSNLSRMARHRQYLQSLTGKLLGLSKYEVLDTYSAVKDYTVTDMGSGSFQKISEKLQDYRQLETVTVDGHTELLGQNVAYILDEQSLQQTILQLFYEVT